MLRRTLDLLLALLLLSLAFRGFGHLTGTVVVHALAFALGGLAHHLRLLLAAVAVVVALRALPHPSARLLEALLGAWAVRLLLAGTEAA
jgi:hypothetical protein